MIIAPETGLLLQATKRRRSHCNHWDLGVTDIHPPRGYGYQGGWPIRIQTPHPGISLNFHPDRGGGGGLPSGPPRPLPTSAQVQLRSWVLGIFFGDGKKSSQRLWNMPYAVY